ncbi:MAG: hypothetical protein ACRDIV_23015 [Ktedonobacteraceae bacterium]
MLPHQELNSRAITWSVESLPPEQPHTIPAYGHLRRLQQDLPEMHRHLERIVQTALHSGSGTLQLGISGSIPTLESAAPVFACHPLACLDKATHAIEPLATEAITNPRGAALSSNKGKWQPLSAT